ncbi:MAG: ABC transporter substrate-binding protein [Planctomycetota bacterium]|jgi:putative ABC transport system substrate-binding protein
MINKIRVYLVLIIILSALFQCAYCAHAEITAIVIKSQNLSAYNKVAKGFQDECLHKKITIKSVYGLNGKMKIGQKIIRKVRKEKPDIILTIGVLATAVAKKKIKDIPIVFCMVINHERFHLSAPNITGISTEIAVEDQLKEFQSILGSFKNMGVIYDPSKTGNIVKSAEMKMKHLGVNLAKYEISSSKMIPEAMENLIGKIDALWVLPDSTVVTKKSFSLIKAITLEHKIPLLCTSDAFVKAGALAAVSSDYDSVGKQAAGLVRKVLEQPSPCTLGIVCPDHFKLSVNTDTAEKLGIKLAFAQENPGINMYP